MFKYHMVGKHVQQQVKGSTVNHLIDLTHVRNQYLVVLAPKEEFINERGLHLVGSQTSSKCVALMTAMFRGPKDHEPQAKLDINMFWRTKLNITKCASTQHFESSGKIF
eukprot:12903647-Ditylum_brightwellii.AAC.1